MTAKAMNKWMNKKKSCSAFVHWTPAKSNMIIQRACGLTTRYLRGGGTMRVDFFNSGTERCSEFIRQRAAVTRLLTEGCSDRECPCRPELLVRLLLAAWDPCHCSLEMSAARPSSASPFSRAHNSIPLPGKAQIGPAMWVKKKEIQPAKHPWDTWDSDRELVYLSWPGCLVHSDCLTTGQKQLPGGGTSA